MNNGIRFSVIRELESLSSPRSGRQILWQLQKPSRILWQFYDEAKRNLKGMPKSQMGEKSIGGSMWKVWRKVFIDNPPTRSISLTLAKFQTRSLWDAKSNDKITKNGRYSHATSFSEHSRQICWPFSKSHTQMYTYIYYEAVCFGGFFSHVTRVLSF